MKKYSLTLVIGGAASGKSEYAENRIARQGSDILYLATSLPSRSASRTSEWRNKVGRHRSRRPPSWRTEVLAGDGLDSRVLVHRPDGILLDSMSLWVAARFITRPRDSLHEDLSRLLDLLVRSAPLVVVSDEVGLGLVPVARHARAYVDALGRCNAMVASRAARVFWMVAGCPVSVKP